MPVLDVDRVHLLPIALVYRPEKLVDAAVIAFVAVTYVLSKRRRAGKRSPRRPAARPRMTLAATGARERSSIVRRLASNMRLGLELHL